MIALLLLAIPAQAQQLGRLFFTPDQRATLENLKGKPAAAVTQMSETITVNGLVQRSDGGSIVWINGVPQASGQAEVPRRGVAPSSVPVVLPGSGRTVQMKVGQSLEVSSGTVKEGAPIPRPAAVPAITEPPQAAPGQAAQPPGAGAPPPAPERPPGRTPES